MAASTKNPPFPATPSAGRENAPAEEAPLLPEHARPGPAQAGGSASVLGAVFNVSTTVVGAGIMSIPAAMRVLGVAPAVALITGIAVLANAAVDFLLRYTRGADGRRVRPRRGRPAQRVRRRQRRRHPHRVPHHRRRRDVRRGGRQGRAARGGAAGVVRAPLVDRPGGGAGGGRRDSPASRAPQACRFAEVHVGHLHPASGGVHAHQPGDRCVRALQGHRDHAADAPGLLQALLTVRALHRRPRHRRRLHLPLQRAPDPRGAEQDVGHEGGGARLPRALRRHLRRRGLLRLPPLRGRHHGRRARQLRQQLGRRRPAGAQRRGAVQYALHVVLVFPLLLFSLRVNVDELLFPGRRPLATDTRRFVSLTAVLMVVLYALAIAIPSVWMLFEYSGSTFAVTISLIFPGAIVLRDVHGIAKRKDKALAATMIILAVVTSSIAIASNIMNSISDKVRVGHVASR